MGIPERWKGHPPLPPDLEERLPGIVERLRRGGAELVYLFGSAAQGPTGDDEAAGPRREPQDVDLATWGVQELDRLRPDIEGILGTDRFDIVRMEAADPELRFEIVAKGSLLFSRDAEVENRVEMRVLREYRDMAPFRRRQRELLRERHGIRGS